MKDIPGSFTETSAAKLYQYALEVDGAMAEIGVDQGRSASVLLYAARHTGASVLLVDNWKSVLIENKAKLTARLMDDFADVDWKIIHADSLEAAQVVETRLYLIHIDADHWGDAPEQDCAAWLPKLWPEGVACFHDYGVVTMGDAVTQAVDKHTAGWEDLGDWEGLAIRRKP